MLHLTQVMLLALLLSACGGQAEPTATPAQTATPTHTATPVAPPAPAATPLAAATPATTLETLGAEIASDVVAAVADDAVAFVLEKGAANVTADQLTAALLGVLGRLGAWVAGTGGETALADCRALLPGVIARSENHATLDALLAACESEDAAIVEAALQPFAALLP